MASHLDGRPQNVAIVGATGAVGAEFLTCLEQRDFPVGELRLLASARSAGRTLVFRDRAIPVQELTERSFAGVDLALFSAGSPVSKKFAPIAIAAWASMGAVAAAIGPTIGGLLVDGLGWRSVFYLNVPFGVLGVVAGRRILAESRETNPGPFPDLVGSALLALAVGSVSYALVQSDQWGWIDARTVGAIVAGLTLAGLFVVRSRLQAAPALDLDLFRIPSFRWGNLATAIFGGFTPAVCTWLIKQTGNPAAPALWLSLAAAISLVGAFLSRNLGVGERDGFEVEPAAAY